MTDAASTADLDLLRDVTDEMARDAAGFREDPIPIGETAARQILGLAALPSGWRETISAKGHEFIIRWETGGRDYYEKVIRGRPVWPGYASGITIGCGFDLGYHDRAQFEAQWRSRLAGSDFERLCAVLGFRTTAPNREAKAARAKALVKSLSDIVTPWSVAVEQFENAKCPEVLAQMYGALDNLDRLHPHCRAALFSLTLNRGPAFSAAGDRFREMREIRDALRAGSAGAIARIPALIRGMARIWGKDSSLAARREGEARLFQAGLDESRLLAKAAPAAARSLEAALAPLAETHPSETHEGVDCPQTDIPDAEELEAAGGGFAGVRWNPRDDEQPDYRHLDTALAGASFDLLPADLDALIAANEFAPLPGKILFALRGALLGGAATCEDAMWVGITDQRPDHCDFRCVLGVYDPAAQRLWAYQGSTVPNAAYVARCCALARAHTPMGKLIGNILPTGCYTYTVGTHHKGGRGEIPTAFRLGTTAANASEVVVLRSLADTVYDRFDAFCVTTPADNIHPGQMRSGFSSAGCLTLPGLYRNGRHTGAWASFRAAAGVGDRSDGKQFSLLLVTGLDAALAASVRKGERAAADLRRLRHGSTGPRVAALQAALGLSPDPSRKVGPVTRRALIARQTAALGWADGVYSPAMDGLLGFNVYGDAPERADGTGQAGGGPPSNPPHSQSRLTS